MNAPPQSFAIHARRRAGLQHQIAHAIAAGRLAEQPLGRMQGTPRKDVAVGGAVHQFHPLAQPGELHRVLADDVAGAQAGKARLRAAASGRLPSVSAVPEGASCLCT